MGGAIGAIAVSWKPEWFRDTVFSEDILDDIREDLEDFRYQRKADAHAQGKGTDDSVALAEAGLRQHLHAADDDGTKHHDGTAS